MPVVILTTLGARSGKLRKTALMRVELQDGPVRRDLTAREITGEEKALWWERSLAAYPRTTRRARRVSGWLTGP